MLLGQWHGDGHTLVVQPGGFPFEVVDDEGEDDAACAVSAANTAGQPWRQRLITIAEENRALFDAHPWAATVSTRRPPLGPGLIGKYEHELSALDGLGLDDVEMDDYLSHLLTFVQASARAVADARAAQAGSAMDDEQWWASNAPLLARVLDERAYPRRHRGRCRAPQRSRPRPCLPLQVAPRPRRARLADRQPPSAAGILDRLKLSRDCADADG
ncbi:MAG TPA: TetR/AcrR family transcriptional regulator C-terminal domain-containing protein [Pseudonocardiaceae bacterium]|nr:TetR/AcrR family transcriptional regulator C-terminal domain-containing protein [Pseudonocardiaceae bacterium]